MEKATLLIADSNPDFQQALAEALSGFYQIRCCQTGTEALDILRKEPCEILILDLLLPQLDGISLLQVLARERIHPTILVISSFLSDYVMKAVSQLGVGYVMQKPCDISATVNQVAALSQSVHLPRFSPAERVSQLLLSLSVSAKHDGYAYLQEAILLMAQDPTQPITKELYPRVGQRFDRKSRVVERSIRSSLDFAWKHRQEHVWNRYFLPSDKRPSNGVFISRLAEVLRLHPLEDLIAEEPRFLRQE